MSLRSKLRHQPRYQISQLVKPFSQRTLSSLKREVKAERRRNNVGRKRIGHAAKTPKLAILQRLNRQHKSVRLGHPRHLFKQGFWLSKMNQTVWHVTISNAPSVKSSAIASPCMNVLRAASLASSPAAQPLAPIILPGPHPSIARRRAIPALTLAPYAHAHSHHQEHW